MADIITSFIIVIAIIVIVNVLIKKIDNITPKTDLISLIVMALIAMLARDKISNHDIKVLYCLVLVIASGIGRYGTIMRSKMENDLDLSKYTTYRQIVYATMFIYGLLGLIGI